MEQTTTVTLQLKRVSARYGHNRGTQKECTPTGGNNTPEEATVTETERQHAHTPDITPKEAIVTEMKSFCALVQVMLHYYEDSLLEEEINRQQPQRHRRELEHLHQKKKRHHHQRLENRHQGLEHYRKKLGCP